MRTYPIFILLFLSIVFACGNNEAEATVQQQPNAEAVPVADSSEPANEPAAVLATPVAKEDEKVVKSVPESKTPKNSTTSKMPPQKPAAALPQAPGMEQPKSQAVEAEPARSEPTPVPQNVVEEQPVVVAAPSHAIWDGLLRKYINSAGRVNYAGLKKEMGKLNEYLDLLSKNPPEASWSKAEEMAFWINAYNAFTVKLILDNYPVSSITKLQGGQPWKFRWIKIGSKTYTLDELENSILRPKFKEARIHFAVNCAAKSCPPLLNQAWTAQNLESNFEKQAKAFVNNPAFNKINASSIQVSKIFEWYETDFGDLISFLNRYSTVKIKPGTKVSFMEYDWALNEQ